MLVCVVRFGMFIHLYFFFVCVFWLLSCARVDFKLIYILSLCAGDKKTYLLDKTHWQKKPRTKQYGFTICQWNNTISRDSSNLKGSLKMRCEMELCDFISSNLTDLLWDCLNIFCSFVCFALVSVWSVVV